MPRLMIKRIQGFNLIEIAVTIAITAVGLLGLSSLQLQSMKATQDTGSRSQAIWIANEIINRIRANEENSVSYITAQAMSCNSFNEVKMCGAYHDGQARVQADLTCSGAEVAMYDLFDVLCGPTVRIGDGSIPVKTNSASSLSDPRIQITRVGALDMSLEISWNAKSSGFDAANERKYLMDDQVREHRARYTIARFRP